jgi:molecular chaperone DnaK (HSP70)
MSTFVGIDLGTTNSVVAYRNAYGRPEVIPNRDGANVTPSVIYFGSDPPAVGQEAKEWARLGNDEIASFFKPHMGNPLFRLSFHGRDYDATDLSALVLKRLKEDAEARLGEAVDRAVITVPAYFGDPQRKATIEAGRKAGLEVLRILNEPTAAALAYGLQRTDAAESVLIYDLGGGTFDVTVARIEPDEVAVLATAGDHDLGGKNWDDRIATFLAEKFAADTGIDPLDNPLQLNDVLTLSERAKWALSERGATRITLQLGPERRGYDLSRAEFEGMTFPLMDRTRRLTEEALAEAGLSWGDLAGVLLVGGSTRMPMVRQYVTQMSGKPPRAGVNVDEVVALGAAIRAAMEVGQSSSSATPRFTLAGSRRVRDVMSHSLGVVAVSEDGSSYVNDIIIRRNQPIPVEGTKSYLHATYAGRNDSLEVYLTQGESARPLDCAILGKYVFSGIQATEAEVTIDVGLSYDADGVVQVRAVQRDTRQVLPMTVERVPDDLSWLGRPPVVSEPAALARLAIYLLLDASSSMLGEPIEQARDAARAFLEQCDFTRTVVGLVSFATDVVLQAEATDNARKIQSAIQRLEAGGSTNLTGALDLAADRLRGMDAMRYIVLLTDGYPDSHGSALRSAEQARAAGIDIVAIGIGDADEPYLRQLASTEAGSIFAQRSELVQTFGRIARVIASGGRALRKLS